MINKAKDMGLLQLPIPTGTSNDFPVNMLMIRFFFSLRSLLNSFSMSTGLRVNFNKSMMIPINVSDERLEILARTFGCSKGSLPYLGLPLSIARPRAQDFLLIVKRCEKRLAGMSSFLNQAGCLQMTNAVLSSLLTFFMCTPVLPKAVIKQIDKYRKYCLWRGSDINARKPPKAAYKMVCKPKDEGGLGVIDIEKQNKALLIKNFHKFFNKIDFPWVNLIWEKHYRNGKLPNHVKRAPFGGGIP